MSKQLTRLVFFALVAAVLCPAQPTRSTVTPLGNVSSCFTGTGVLGVQTQIDNTGSWAGAYRDNNLWRYNLIDCTKTPLLTAPSAVSFNYAMVVANDGTIFFAGLQQTTDGTKSGTFRLNPDGTVMPVVINGQSYSLWDVQTQALSTGIVNYTGDLVLSRDSKFVYLEGVFGNNWGSLISYEVATGKLSALTNGQAETDLNFAPIRAESGLVYGLLTKGNNLDTSSRLGVYNLKTNSVTTVVDLNPVVNGITYDLGLWNGSFGANSFQSASSAQGLLFAASRHGSTAMDLLFYSLATGQLSLVGNSRVTLSTALSMNGNGEGAFDTRNFTPSFNSALFSFRQDAPAPELVSGPGTCAYTGDADCSSYFPTVTEDGRVIYNYRHAVNGSYVYELVTLVPSDPYIFPKGIVDASAYNDAVAPGQITSLFGHGFSDQTVSAPADVLPLPTNLAGTEVWVNGVPAPLYFVSPGQVNLQWPYEPLDNSTATVQVVKNGDVSLPLTIKVSATNISIFQTSLGSAAIHFSDGSLVTPNNPATDGEILILFANGAGRTNPAAITGAGAKGETCAQKFRAFAGGIDAGILWCGLTPGLVGLNQFNIVLPFFGDNGNGQPSPALQKITLEADPTQPTTFFLPYKAKAR